MNHTDSAGAYDAPFPAPKFYVEPYISIFTDRVEALADQPAEINPFLPSREVVPDFVAMNSYKLAFVIGEPGHGKSVFMQKLYEASLSDTSLIIDCKDIVGMGSAVEFIANFALLDHLYFDGLDEVPPMYFVEVLRAISDLTVQRPELHIFVSCRLHYMIRFENELKAMPNAIFVKMLPFDSMQIRSYLENFIAKQDIVEAVVEKSRGSLNGKSVLQTPRYLEALVRSILQSEISVEEIGSLTRADIFERVIYYKLISEVESSKKGIDDLVAKKGTDGNMSDLMLDCIIAIRKEQVQFNETYITQRVLEKLALIMEIYQRNRITKAELVTFLDEANSNINLIFLGNSNVDTLVERTLKTMENDTIEFENTEFQEYLAAKELVRLGSIDQVLYDLVLHSDLKIIFVNWYDVIQYALELDAPKIIVSLASFLKSSPEKLYDERLSMLLLGQGVDRVSEELKAQLFDALFLYYQSNGLYVYQYNDAIARLYSPKLNSDHVKLVELKDESEPGIRQFVNRIMVIGSICRFGHLGPDDISDWKNYLLKCLVNPVFKGKGVIYWGLEPMDALTELIGLKDTLFLASEQDIRDYLTSLSRISADGANSVFLEALKAFPYVTGKEDFVDRLQSESSITELLDLLLEKDWLLEHLFNDEHGSVDFFGIFGHISDLNSDELDKKIKELFLFLLKDGRTLYQRGTKKTFMDRSLEHLLSRDPSFLDELFAIVDLDDLLSEFDASLVRKMDVDRFEKLKAKSYVIYGSGSYGYGFGRIIHQLKINGAKAELKSELQTKYPDLFKEYDEGSERAAEREAKRLSELHDRFVKLQMPGQAFYNSEIFSFVNSNVKELKVILSTEEVDYIKDRVSETLNAIDPDKFDVKVSVDGNTVSFAHYDNRWFRLSNILGIALELGMDELLNTNRSKVFKYLPMVNEQMPGYQQLIPRLLRFYGGMTQVDIWELSNFCLNRPDDYIYVSSRSFAKFIHEFKIAELKPVLKLLIETDKAVGTDRESALEAFGNLSDSADDKAYLEGIFNAFGQSFPILSDLANEFLVSKYLDEPAAKWRFDEIRKRTPKISTVDDLELPFADWDLNMNRRNFCSCFSDPKNGHFEKEMLDLLDFAFTLRKNDYQLAYSNRLMKMIVIYFKRYNNQESIKKIYKLLSKPNMGISTDSFKFHLREIETDYAATHQPYNNISDPIKVYNKIKSKLYLPVYDYQDLVSIVDESIAELENFITNGGFGRTAMAIGGKKTLGKGKLFNEDILQKTMKLNLENTLLKKGVRDSDIHREVELFDAKRIDLLISYGFIGPIMAELKLLDNAEIQNAGKRTSYKAKLQQYIAGTNCRYAYYVVFDNDGTGVLLPAFKALLDEYSDIKNLKIVLVNLT